MKLSRRNGLIMMGSALVMAGTPSFVRAQDSGSVHDVKMLNFDPENRRNIMVYKPAVLQIEPGDTVRFVSEDPGHNAVSEENMLPEGAEPFKTPLSKDAEVTLDAEGTYGYFCQPHKGAGMWGLILVGDFTKNLDQVKAAVDEIRGRGKQRMAEYLEQAKQMA